MSRSGGRSAVPWHALLGFWLLVACDGQSEGHVTLDFWAMGREGEVVQELTAEFERLHPGIAVRVQQIPWSAAHEKLLTAYAGDAMPDVFQLGNTWIPEFVALDAISAARRPGRGLGGARARGLLRRASSTPTRSRAGSTACPGTSTPGSCSTGRTSWRGPVRPSRRAAGRPGARPWPASRGTAGAEADAIILPSNEWAPIVILALQQGAELLSADATCGELSARRPFRAALAFYLAMFEHGYASATASAQIANLYQEFGAGRFAMYISGPWNLGEFARRLPADLQDDWATAPMPSPDGSYPGLSLAGGASLAIQRTSEHQDAAWQLVEFLSQTAQQVRFYQLSGNLPARTAAWQDAALAGDPRAGAFFEQLQRIRSTPKIPEWERIATVLTRYLERLVRGETTPDAALAALDAEVDAILEKRRWLLGRASGAEPGCPPPGAAS